MGVSYLTREGYKKLEAELNHLVRVKRREVAEKLEIARSHGDLRENAEYDVAKEEKTMLELRIGSLSGQLAETQIIDLLDIPADKAYVGATVQLKDLNSGEEFTYMLVGEAEADFMENKISITSPIGKTLLGHGIGEVVDIEVPAGMLKYEIMGISREF